MHGAFVLSVLGERVRIRQCRLSVLSPFRPLPVLQTVPACNSQGVLRTKGDLKHSERLRSTTPLEAAHGISLLFIWGSGIFSPTGDREGRRPDAHKAPGAQWAASFFLEHVNALFAWPRFCLRPVPLGCSQPGSCPSCRHGCPAQVVKIRQDSVCRSGGGTRRVCHRQGNTGSMPCHGWLHGRAAAVLCR